MSAGSAKLRALRRVSLPQPPSTSNRLVEPGEEFEASEQVVERLVRVGAAERVAAKPARRRQSSGS